MQKHTKVHELPTKSFRHAENSSWCIEVPSSSVMEQGRVIFSATHPFRISKESETATEWMDYSVGNQNPQDSNSQII